MTIPQMNQGPEAAAAQALVDLGRPPFKLPVNPDAISTIFTIRNREITNVAYRYPGKVVQLPPGSTTILAGKIIKQIPLYLPENK